ncbi:hypothetical protein B484DRAFT_229687 [Ochromonadaceae sp. CCMP2298]|nr:hypothetical protein B484DRAFT_229687 [Ochromonadaceae sp. CCMP2298]
MCDYICVTVLISEKNRGTCSSALTVDLRQEGGKGGEDSSTSRTHSRRAEALGLSETSFSMEEGVEDEDLEQKSGSVVQMSHKWFAQHKVEIALLARALIPPHAHLSQVLCLVLSDCSDCHLDSCTCQSRAPGGFRIVSAMIEVRPGITRELATVEEFIRRAALNGMVLSPMGRLVVRSPTWIVYCTHYVYYRRIMSIIHT